MNKLKESEGLAGPCSPFSSNLLSTDTVSRPIHTRKRWVKRGHRHYSKLFTSGYEIVSASRPRLPSGDILCLYTRMTLQDYQGSLCAVKVNTFRGAMQEVTVSRQRKINVFPPECFSQCFRGFFYLLRGCMRQALTAADVRYIIITYLMASP